LQKHLPLHARKVRDREENERRDNSRNTLDPAVISGGGQAPLGVGRVSKGLAPSPFIPFGHPSLSFPKVLENELGGGGARLSGLTGSPEGKSLTSLPR